MSSKITFLGIERNFHIGKKNGRYYLKDELSMNSFQLSLYDLY